MNTAPSVINGQANPTNLPAPPTDLATVVMNLAQPLQQMQQAQATIQAAIGITLPAAQTPPMLAGQASTAPGESNTVPHAPQTPIMQAQVPNLGIAQGGYQYQPPMYGAYIPQPLDHSRLVERFLKLKPREFNGKPADPLWMAHWVDKIERNFMMMTLNEEEKVLCATFMLKGDAHHWWRSTRAYLLTKHAQLTWDIYKETFFEKYFPRSFKDSIEREFLSLYQGQMTVDAYQ
ncbi:hypothetical protein NE237_007273 [Protea cynaroides]|uniref:Retrotransposon gag domain-containing protein n=1 Tax=Protea cynaroides TaxID=273540 RepID=A0A9Q0QWC6_9MAGN|nr:hypothetical protein NE237_007273 [Protea cynaroides]